MIIEIDPDLRIAGESRAWELQRRPERRSPESKGEVQWRVIGYYTRFHTALQAAFEQEVREHPAEGVAEAIEAINGIHQKYSEVFEQHIGEQRGNEDQ